jgi:hypothetical protein
MADIRKRQQTTGKPSITSALPPNKYPTMALSRAILYHFIPCNFLSSRLFPLPEPIAV